MHQTKRPAARIGEPSKTPLEKIRNYLLSGKSDEKALSPKLADQLKVYEKCWAYFCNGYERRDVAKLLEANDSVSKSNTWYVMKNTEELFGSLYDSRRKALQALDRENAIRMAKKCEQYADKATFEKAKAGFLQAAAKYHELAAKVGGSFERSEGNTIPQLPTLIIMGDPSLLSQQPPTQDTSFELDED